ncbi:hypothetical protein F5148DRAFT_1355272 [Russula earlei]|uniref:Uncharacterized protein n=1 Tax=Russula earlei TaxID=71964 RepID=A0ACC0UC84_9AGAM|nr:hypothetical protein F5148DRAFT_1355272 [Russula earlei]
MAACVPTPTLTLFSTSTSTSVLTTSTVTVETLPDGSVSSVTVPVIITNIITIVNPTSTLFASCSSSTTPISSITSSSSSPRQIAPSTYVITTIPAPTVVTSQQTTTINGAVTVITITSTSIPPATVVYLTTIVSSVSQTPTSRSSSSSIGPIAGGAGGGFLAVVVVVITIWYMLKKCRKPNADREEDDNVFPYPVTRDRDHTRRLDLSKETRPYEYGLVGRSTPASHSRSGSEPGMISQSRTGTSNGRPDSVAALIGPSIGGGFLPREAVSGGDVQVVRQPSHHLNHPLPPGAAPPQSQSGGGGSSVSGSSATPGPSNRRLQVVNPALSPASMLAAGYPSGAASGSSSVPLAVAEPERQKNPAQDDFMLSSSGPLIVHTDGGRLHSSDHRPSASASGPESVPESTPAAQPARAAPEPTDAPPAYSE